MKNYNLAKYSCYMLNFTMAFVLTISPLLFVTFNEMYGISFTLLGFLAVIGFAIQIFIDFVFSFFARYFNIHKTVRVMPLIALVGVIIYAVMPPLFPNHAYLWIVLATLTTCLTAGLSEVLCNPIITAIPSDNTEKELSKLHSTYAWGVVIVVIITTVLLRLFGRENWYFVVAIWALLPLTTFILFLKADIPPIILGDKSEKVALPKTMPLFFLCILLGSVAENTMTQWASSFLEIALGIPKTVGDIFGLALFATLLGLGRSLYAKFGKNIYRVLCLGMLGSAICYILCAVSPLPIISLFACILTGICSSMLWPGSLILLGENNKNIGVVAFAIMAAGGDSGGAIGPQLIGALFDKLMANPNINLWASLLCLTPQELSMKFSLLVTSIFPILGFILLKTMKSKFLNLKKE